MDVSNIIRDITKQRVLIYLSLVISLIKENHALFFFFFRNKHTYTKEREMSSKKNRTLSKKKTPHLA